MRVTSRIFTLIGLLFLGIAGFSQGISNKGKEFWVGYGHHQFMETGTNTQEMTIYLSAEEQPATVTVTIDSSGLFPANWWRRTYNIPAYTVISIEDVNANTFSNAAGARGPIPKGATGQQYDARLYTDPPPSGTGGAGLFRKKGIRIQSDVPIVAYAHIYGSASSGATTLIPVEAWGYDYVSINSKQSYASNCYNWMYIIASRDNTVVEITPSVKTRAQDKTGLRPGQPTLVTLMKGQMYQVIGANDGSDANGNGGTSSTGLELTGTRVRSFAQPGGECFPIAVFSGSSRTSNPASCGSGGGDNDNYQMYPQHAWGRRYLLAPFSSGAGVSSYATATYKIAIKDVGQTEVKRNGQTVVAVGQNTAVYQFESNGFEYIESTKPITIVQFMTGGGCMPGSIGDPAKVAISPLEQGIKQVGFYRNTKEGISVNYLTLIVKSAGVPSLRIDNSNAFDQVVPHPRLAGYSVVTKRWNAAKAQVIVKCDSAFNAITYGLGSVESYAYSAGAYFNNLNAISNISNIPDTSNGGNNRHLYTCVNTPSKLSVLMRYQPLTLKWNLASMCNVVAPCQDVTMNPASTYYEGPVTVDGIVYHKYTLPGTYTFSQVGMHDIKVEATSLTLDQCNNKEDLYISIDVKPKPYVNFSINHTTRCELDTAYFNGPASSANGYTLGYWDWSFDNGAVIDSVRNPKHLFAPGAHTAKLTIATTQGCAADTSINFNVVAKPTADFTANPPAVCLGQAITFNGTSTYTGPTGINGWHWDFGNGTTVNATNGNAQTVTYTTPDQYVVKHMVKVSALCVSDTVEKIVPVHPGAVLGFTYPTGCLPSSGIAQFTADATDVGGQPIVSYLWNFGDPNATASNPNTSTAQNPTHTYSAFGNYTVTLSVVTASGCAGDTAALISMNVQPTTTYPALNPVCINSGVISVATASVTNGVPGRGKYFGAGTDTLGNFNPAVAGAGPHEIRWIFVSDGGCTDTARRTIIVNPLPAKPVVSSPVNYCQNATATALTATGDAGSTFIWYNNAALGNGSPTAPTPSTATAGSTTYYVTQTNTEGCTSDTATIEIVVSPGITGNTIGADQTLCSSGASADTLRSTTTVGGGNGTLNYQWQQSTDNGATWTNIPGATTEAYFPGAVNGEVRFRRIITSGLCTSTSNVVTVTVVQGFTNADIAASQTICEGSAPSLLNGQTAQGGGTIAYQWQVSTDGTTWTNIAGATGEDYQPGSLTTTTYYRRQVSNSVCTATSSVVEITVTPIANGAITGPAAICAYDAAAVTFNASAGTAPFTVQLTITAPGGASSTITETVNNAGPATINVLAANSAAGNYTVAISSLQDVNGCARTTGFAPVNITVHPKPVLTVTADVAVCAGTSTTLQASGATDYSWSPATGLNASTGNQVIATPTATTTYTVTGTANGCAADPVSVTVTVNPVPAKPTVTTPVAYCQNDVATALSATAAAGNTLTWYNNAALTNGTTTAPTPSTAVGGTSNYYVTQTNAASCVSDTATITVTVQPSITGNNIGADQTLCSAGAAAALNGTATVAGGTGTYTYVWEQSVDGGTTWTSITSATAASYSPGTLTTTTMYRRSITSGLCSSTSNVVTITVLAPFTGTGINGSQVVCANVAPSVLDGDAASAGTAAVNYQWQQSLDNVTFNNIAGAVAEDYQPPVLTATTHFRRQVSNATCNAMSNVITVTVNPLPNGAITGPASICVYDEGSVTFTANTGAAPYTVQLTVTGPAGYSNTVTQTVPNNNAATISVIPANSAAGSYQVVISSITDNNTCSRTTGFTPVTITVNPKPVLTVSANTAICGGDSTALTVTGATTYTWSPATGLSNTTGSTVMAKPTATTTYTVNGTSNGCTADAVTVTVTVNPVPAKPAVTRPVAYCQDATATPLNATAAAGNTLTWYNNAALTNGSNTAPTPTTASPGSTSYFVTQTSSAGCTSDTSRIVVVVSPLPTVNFQLPEAMCMTNGRATVQFMNQTSVVGGGAFTSSWNFGDGNTSTERNPVHSYSTPGPHQVTLEVTTAGGCIGQVVKTLPAFLQKPVADFAVTPDTLCQGTPSSFTDLSTAQGSTVQSWRWSFGDGSTSQLRNPVKNYPLPGNYTVKLTVMNAQGCQSDTTRTVRVYLQPVIDAGPSFVVAQGTVVTFAPFVKDSTNLTYLWTTSSNTLPPASGLSDPTILSPSLVVERDQVYALTATGQGQCTASDTLYVKSLLPLRIPNAFSPNGDGINDTWEIPNLRDYPGSTVEVFNRYGQSVYRTIGYDKGWNGTFNGSPLPVGVYYYIIELKNGFNQVTGSVTILK
ncbi:PKD domain-containing protein [Aridibaculum aurantiacum]|uniref:PKD domain-containing protein n=1 Tax=Aridibaculum aurantiacum TaxID=2810307 RepID=UPI001A9584CB|nr:PKD domain-containing protein [Aridibaculum aurantiacum]